MVARQFALIYLILSLFGNESHADGLFFRLPKDGTWATYTISIKHHNGTTSTIGDLQIASVGRVIESDQICRWIEIQMQFITTMPQPKLIFKLLIPERYLIQGETPVKHILHAWARIEAPNPFGFETEEEMTTDPDDLKMSDAMLPIVLVGPCITPKRLKPIQVDNNKLGEFTCEGVWGIYESKDNKNKTTKYEVESRFHHLSPFGIVTARWKDINGNDEGEIIFTLTDFGEGAISKIKGKIKDEAFSALVCSAGNQMLAAGKCCMLKARTFHGHKIHFRRCSQFGIHHRK